MIYAVDFDGTLCKEAWPEIGEPNRELIEFLLGEKEKGAELILWTMREGEPLQKAVEWCKEKGLVFDAVNDNLEWMKQKWNNNPRKVYADMYIDDHNGGYNMNQCEQLLDYMQKHGSITGMESIEIGVMNYKGRINDLRKLGFDIKTKMETKVNSKGEKKTFARYYLA